MLRIYIFLLTLSCSTSVNADYKEVVFNNISLAEATASSINNGQYTLVFFTADWCLPCQILRESHFRDERIIDQINNEFVSVEADYSDYKDQEWFLTYKVRFMPTLLVIDEYGNEIDRIQKIEDTRELYQYLHRYGKKSSSYKPLAYHEAVYKTPKAAIEKHKGTSRPKPTLVSKKPPVKNIYEIDIDSYESDMSIQFAAYIKYGNALKYLHTLSQEGLPVSMVEEYVNGKKYYKVVQRASKKNIKRLYNQYKSQGKECFIRSARIKS